MTDYSQPYFYHFNEDSLRLAEKVKKKIGKAERILDLGAGCGIIGIELAIHFSPRTLTLVELQEEYKEHITKNLKLFLPSPGIESQIEISSFSNWNPSGSHDLIVCNPPYYLPGHGQKSKDERRGCARSFIEDDWKVLLYKIHEAITPEGRSFLVVKNDQRIIAEIMKNLQGLKEEISAEGDLLFIELSRLNKDRGHELP